MAFSIDVDLVCYEYRGERSGTMDDGTEWYQLVMEKPNGDAQQVNVSVPKDLWAEVDSMRLAKGDILTLPINASSGSYNGRQYARLRLIGKPERVYVDDDGVIS